MAGKFVSNPTKAANVTVKVTPAQADRPAGFIKPGNKAPKNGKATMKKRDTATPDILAGECVNNADGLEKGEMHYSCTDHRRFLPIMPRGIGTWPLAKQKSNSRKTTDRPCAGGGAEHLIKIF
ncbi:hypothetical protein [Yoonia sp.]|uniref:hypothetical protein n=1 Tax=Yoonia sp. TaxID=2212373 RepID=UPI00358E080B